MSKSVSTRQAIALAALLVTGASASAAEYSIEPIRSPFGGSYVSPTSIASNGMVVGSIYDSNRHTSSCFKYLNGVVTILPLPPGSLSCSHAVTDRQGNITMNVKLASNPNASRAVELTTKGKFITLSGLTEDTNRVLASKGGRMAGWSRSASGAQQAYLFNRQGGGVNVGALTGLSSSALNGINIKGWAVGSGAMEGSDKVLAFQYKDGKIAWLSPLTPGASAEANAINARGTIVGGSESTAGDHWSDRAVTWQGKSAPTNLGTMFGLRTKGIDINSTGVVVGGYDYNDKPFRMRDGIMTPLADLIDPQQRYQWGSIDFVNAISDEGLIAGSGTYNGVLYSTGFLLRPIP